jgi:EAL domain-containing protein (putative c-di-GMP-specific phosphodiesterase class I)
MMELRKLGVRLAMDDFRAPARRRWPACATIPLSVIKNRSLVPARHRRRPDVMALVHATLLLIENLGRETVAEGVENAEQVAALQSLGCRYAQGYYFARPTASIELSGRQDADAQIHQPAA